MEDIHLYCTSSVDGITKANTPGDFECAFPRRFNLNNDYRIGLVEITYPASIYNIKSDQKVYLYEEKEGQISVIHENAVSAGKYKDIDTLVGCINSIISAYRYYSRDQAVIPQLKYNEFTNKMSLTVQPKHITLKLDPHLDSILGTMMKDESGFVGFTTCVDFTDSVPGLFVYCNLVSPTIYGSTYVNILRVVENVPFATKFGDQVWRSFSNPLYLPLAHEEFQSCRIIIKDDQGKTIDFKDGETAILLRLIKTR